MKCKIYERYKNYDETCEVNNHDLLKAILENRDFVQKNI